MLGGILMCAAARTSMVVGRCAHRASCGAPVRAVALRGGVRAMSATAEKNALLATDGLPQFEAIAPADVEPAMRGLLSRLESNFADFESGLKPGASYAEIMEAMEKIEDPVEYAWGVVGHLMGVKNSDELRAAHAAMQPDVVTTTTKLSQSTAVFSALEALDASSAELDPAQRRIVEARRHIAHPLRVRPAPGQRAIGTAPAKRHMPVAQASLKSMKLSGVGLTGEARETFNGNRQRLAELSTKFSNHVLDATKAFELVITDPAQVLLLSCCRRGGQCYSCRYDHRWCCGRLTGCRPQPARSPHHARPRAALKARRPRRARGSWALTCPRTCRRSNSSRSAR